VTNVTQCLVFNANQKANSELAESTTLFTIQQWGKQSHFVLSLGELTVHDSDPNVLRCVSAPSRLAGQIQQIQTCSA